MDYIKKETRSILIKNIEKPTGKLVKNWNINNIEVIISIQY
jgi:hypothetical protein